MSDYNSLLAESVQMAAEKQSPDHWQPHQTWRGSKTSPPYAVQQPLPPPAADWVEARRQARRPSHIYIIAQQVSYK